MYIEILSNDAGEAMRIIAVLSRRTILYNRIIIIIDFVVEDSFVSRKIHGRSGNYVGEIGRNIDDRPRNALVGHVVVVFCWRTLNTYF